MNDQHALGLERGLVALREHDLRWAPLFTEERQRLCKALGVSARDIQHVGSTAVPGMKAKPILDIAVGVTSLSDLPLFRAALEPIGYEYLPDRLPNNLVFGKGAPLRTHLVHIVTHGGEDWSQYEKVRLNLISSPAAARQYEALKVKLAASHAGDRQAYTKAKAAFIHELLAGRILEER